MFHADSLSHLPLPVTTQKVEQPGDLLHIINHMATTNFNVKAVRDWTQRDPVLSRVHLYMLEGWPAS